MIRNYLILRRVRKTYRRYNKWLPSAIAARVAKEEELRRLSEKSK